MPAAPAADLSGSHAEGVLSVYVDDGFGSRSPGMKKVVDTIAEHFEIGKSGETEFDHLGLHVAHLDDPDLPGKKLIDHSAPNYKVAPVHIEEKDADGKKRTLDTPATPAEYSAFRTALGRMSWISALVARVCAPASLLASRVGTLCVRDLREFNQVVADARLNDSKHVPHMQYKYIDP